MTRVLTFLGLLFLAGVAADASCTPKVTVPPVTPDATPCAVDQAVASARLIRWPDGSAYQAPADCGP
jgi:hypothetical protein